MKCFGFFFFLYDATPAPYSLLILLNPPDTHTHPQTHRRHTSIATSSSSSFFNQLFPLDCCLYKSRIFCSHHFFPFFNLLDFSFYSLSFALLFRHTETFMTANVLLHAQHIWGWYFRLCPVVSSLLSFSFPFVAMTPECKFNSGHKCIISIDSSFQNTKTFFTGIFIALSQLYKHRGGRGNTQWEFC